MSYNTTLWRKGDIISSAKLNNIENGIAENDKNVTLLKENSVYISEEGYMYSQNLICTNGSSTIDSNAFKNAIMLKQVNIPSTINTINSSAFMNCPNLENIILPNTLTSVYSDVFNGCINVKSIILGTNFNCSISFKDCNLSVDCMTTMFNSLKNLTSSTAKTLTLGSTNLAKLTDEQKQIATNKNWNLS